MNAHITAAGLVAEAREKIREVAPRAFAEHRRDGVFGSTVDVKVFSEGTNDSRQRCIHHGSTGVASLQT